VFDAQLLAAALQCRSAFDKFAPHIEKADLTPPAGFWYDIVREWYARDPQAKSIDKTVLVEMGKKRITNEKHVDGLLGFMSDLPEAPSPDNVAQVVLELKRYNVGMQLAAAIGRQDVRAIAGLHKQFGDLLAQTELRKAAQWEDAVSWEELDDKVGDKKRIPIAPRVVNRRAGGGALPGHHILIYGRPEAGKSTMAINMTHGFLYTGQRALYVGNEDNINVLKKRMRNRLTGLTDAEIAPNPERANKLAREREREHGGELMMRHLHRGDVGSLEQAIEEFEPTVLILDQIRNLESRAGKESKVEKMEQVAIDVRRVLSTYGLVGVSVTQANDRTERHGQKSPIWLGLGDVDSSRTGLPGQVDLALGLGADTEMLERGQRACSFAKNKLNAARDAKGGVLLEFNVELSKVKGYGE
jgi:archaellum biogenesis ATPase FlaH